MNSFSTVFFLSLFAAVSLYWSFSAVPGAIASREDASADPAIVALKQLRQWRSLMRGGLGPVVSSIVGNGRRRLRLIKRPTFFTRHARGASSSSASSAIVDVVPNIVINSDGDNDNNAANGPSPPLIAQLISVDDDDNDSKDGTTKELLAQQNVNGDDLRPIALGNDGTTHYKVDVKKSTSGDGEKEEDNDDDDDDGEPLVFSSYNRDCFFTPVNCFVGRAGQMAGRIIGQASNSKRQVLFIKRRHHQQGQKPSPEEEGFRR